MPLKPGSRVGAYEILAAVGAGGMGEVYRGRDTRLQRDVAIKVLPDLFARDPERLARFEREARVLAALNHPHIAQVYGVEGGALVMEFVEGEDLAQRLARSGPMDVEDALPIARQIAEALEAAHEQGIIHRDLKPANIKVRPDGAVKVLDFGLAKALAPPDRPAGSPGAAENSPTITSPFNMSNLGVILGTAAYMAPEQARGKPIDKRADVWAFGCVLYELLTAKRPFEGEDVTDTLAAIVRADPDWDALPPDTPPAIRTLLRRCLEKDRRERLPDIGSARLELKDARMLAAPPDPRRAAAGTHARRPMPWLPWSIAALSLILAIAAMAWALRPQPQAPVAVVTAAILPPAALNGAPALRFALSPDGRSLAFIAPDGSGTAKLWIRALDRDAPQVLAGTERASAPFWSPDGRAIAFFSEGKIRKIDAAGGPVVALAPAGPAPPGAWNRGDVILVSGPEGSLVRVSAATPGTSTVATALARDAGERIQILPSFLPDGEHFVYTSGPISSPSTGAHIGRLGTTETTLLLAGVTAATYASGYLIFLRGSTLLAQPFNPATLSLSGTAKPIATNVQLNVATGTGAFSVSTNGVLVYQAGTSSGTRLVWVDRSGKPLGTLGGPSGYTDIALSPDDSKVSVTVPDTAGDRADIWLFDVQRSGAARRVTFDGDVNSGAVWSPDGQYLVYSSLRQGRRQLYRRPVSGNGSETPLFEDPTSKYPLDFTPDGRFLLFEVPARAATGRAWLLPLVGERRPVPFNHTRLSEVPVAVSPDGRWAAYVGQDAGARRDVFVTSFPDATGTWQISREGGENPRWRADGKELFYTTSDRFFAVPVNTSGSQFEFGEGRALFDVRVPAPVLGTRSTYAASRDGQRFLINMWDPTVSLAPLTLVMNWPETLKK